jgi:ATP-dependent DNA ligase
MKTWQDKNSSLYANLPFMEIAGNHIIYPCIAEIKFNGEFQYLINDGTGTYLVNKREYGRIRTDMKVTNIKIPEHSVFCGELIYGDGKVFQDFQRHKLTDDLKLVIFQVLKLNKQEIWKVANYTDQRKILEKQIFYNNDVFLVPNFKITNRNQFDDIFDRIVTKQGYEGLVTKDPLSPYINGETGRWYKEKFKGYANLAIMGFKVIKDISLLLGHQVNGQLVPICHCGGGMKDDEKETFLRVLRPLAIDKVGQDYMVKPKIVIRIKHGGVIRDANGNVSSLTSPQFEEVLVDKTLKEVDNIK